MYGFRGALGFFVVEFRLYAGGFGDSAIRSKRMQECLAGRIVV